MDVLKMYIYANWIRDCICCFNVFYYTEPSRVNVDLLITHLELLYQTGTADISYWKDDKIDFEDLREMGNGIKRAVAEEDDSGLSDILNGRLKRQMDRITETLFKKMEQNFENNFGKQIMKRCRKDTQR